MSLLKALTLLILAGLFLAACVPGATPAPGTNRTPVPPMEEVQTPVPPTPFDGGVPQPPAADAALRELAEQLGIAPEQFNLSEIEEVEWPNACLGLPQPDEMCAEVITPGFRLVFEANNQQYQVHTNRDGSQLRFADDLVVDMPASGQQIPAVAAALAELANRTGFSVERIRLVEAVPVEWTDSCLGAGRPEESCLQVITPGYRIILEVEGERYQIHTNEDGSVVRFVEEAGQGGQPGADPSEIGNTAQNLLAHQLGIPTSQINLTTLEAVDWPDACLGMTLPGQMCAQVITPGYRVILEAQGVNYAFHTDDAGGVIIPAIPPLPEAAVKVMVWEPEEEDLCPQAEIGVLGVSFEDCESAPQQAELAPERMMELAALYAAFSPFEMETPAGKVQFHGQGVQLPSDAEMRSVAEWAKLTAAEAEAGPDNAPTHTVIDWSREGGFAGFCDGLAVSITGWAQPSSCRGETPVNFLPYRLQTEALEKVYAWADKFQSFEYEQSDNATADSMTIRVRFTGSGTEAADDAQREEIAQYAAELYNQSKP